MDARYRLQANEESTWGVEVYLQSAITLHGYDDEVLGSKHITDARPTKDIPQLLA